jgi:hypothetical protein
MKNAKILSVQIIPVQGMKAHAIDSVVGASQAWDIIAIRVTVYEDGFTAWYPVNVEHLAVESILDSHQVDMYWDWIEYNGKRYGDYQPFVNPFPDKVV